jgi:serine/threonine protein kinase
MSLQIGQQLGPYDVLSRLGSGGMGEVYLARDKKLGREVALKVLPDVFARDVARMARFAREAQLLAALNHRNIAAIYGVEESAGQPALVLELVGGETLAQRITKGPIRLEEALKIAIQIAEALEAAHEKSVIHRDLKPANVKITSEGSVKVLDFGLAKAVEAEHGSASAPSESPTMISAAATNAGVILGTAAYMAPEQARGKAADRRADIWAFGVILFEMLTAQRPFEGETVSDTLAKILERGGLKSVPDSGGEPEVVTELNSASHEVSHRLPHFLPDGSGLLFTTLRHATSAIDWKRSQIWVKSLTTGQSKLLLENAQDAQYGDNGYLIFARQGKLFGVQFNPATLSLEGTPTPVLDNVTHAAAGIGVNFSTGAAQFSISANGSLVYAPGSIEPPLEKSLVWADRMGRVTPVGSKPMSHGSVRIAPNVPRIAVTEYYVDRIVWTLDAVRGTLERQTFEGLDSDAVWSPDGSSIVFRSNRDGPMRLYHKRLDSRDAVPITPGPLDFPGSFFCVKSMRGLTVTLVQSRNGK